MQSIGIVQVFRSWPHLRMEAKREILERSSPEIFADRYHVHGVTLRMGYNSDNRSRREFARPAFPR